MVDKVEARKLKIRKVSKFRDKEEFRAGFRWKVVGPRGFFAAFRLKTDAIKWKTRHSK